jgi:uncharacterized membrane protein YqiK
MFGFRVPAPDEAMLISGGRSGQNGTPFKVVTGHGAFVVPFIRQASFLTLAMREAEVAEQCVTKQGIAAQTELAQRQAQLRQQQLVAEVVKPAEAEAEKTRALAKADAERMKIQAEAAASHNRVALDRMLIDQLPQIVREAAGGLANANTSTCSTAPMGWDSSPPGSLARG